MEHLQKVGSALLGLVTSILASTLGLLHFFQVSITHTDRVLATLTTPIASERRSSTAEGSSGSTTTGSTFAQQFSWDDYSKFAGFSERDGQIYFDGLPFGSDVDAPKLLVAENAKSNVTPFAKDDRHVYFIDPSIFGWKSQIPIIANADPISFVAIYSRPTLYGFIAYAMDRNHFFSGMESRNSLPIDRANFRILLDAHGAGQFWASDSMHVYDIYAANSVSFIIAQADPNTFMPILDTHGNYTEYAKDKLHVFYFDYQQNSTTELTGVDLATFTVIQSAGYDAYDRNHRYLDGQITI